MAKIVPGGAAVDAAITGAFVAATGPATVRLTGTGTVPFAAVRHSRRRYSDGRPSQELVPLAVSAPAACRPEAPPCRLAPPERSFWCSALPCCRPIRTAAPDSPRLVIFDLGTLPGDYFSSASDINNVGQAVGWSLGPSGQFRAFRWDDGVMTELPPLPGAQFASAAAINEGGQIVGASGGASSHAVLWDAGVPIDLGRLSGATGCSAVDINDRGQITGSCDLARGARVGFLWQRGQMVPLEALPGSDFTIPSALNNFEGVSGGAITASGAYRGIAWHGGAIADLGTLRGGSSSSADGINDRGEIVGSSDMASLEPLAVLWKSGALVRLGTLPGTTWSQALAINDHRHVVGRSGLTPFIWDDGAMSGLPTLAGRHRHRVRHQQPRRHCRAGGQRERAAARGDLDRSRAAASRPHHRLGLRPGYRPGHAARGQRRGPLQRVEQPELRGRGVVSATTRRSPA